MSSIRSSTAPIDVRQLGHRRLPRRLAAAARAGRRPGRRRHRHVAAARAPAGLHRRPAHRAAASGRPTARPSSTPTAAARSPGTARASWSATRSSGWPNRSMWSNYVRRIEESLIKVCAELGLDTSAASTAAPACGCRRGGGRPGAQGRRHRRAGRAGDDAARLRAQLRLRPRRVRRRSCPCGISDAGVTSMSAELGRRVGVDDVRAAVAEAVCDALDGRLALAGSRRRPRSIDTVTVAPEGRKLLRLEVRNAQTPIERKPPWIRTRAADGPGVHRAEEPGPARGSAHRLRGGRLPQHLRVLGGPRSHLPDRRRAVHPALRLLPDRHRQARRRSTATNRAGSPRACRRWACGTPRSPGWPATTCPTAAPGCTPRPCAPSRSSTRPPASSC